MKKINIPLSDQVVDLETARELTDKLASVGIVAESAFYYQRRRNRILNDEIKYSDKSVYTKWQKWVLLEAKRCDSGNAYKQVESIPAYTLPELLEVLPERIENKSHYCQSCGRERCNNHLLTIEKNRHGKWFVGYKCPTTSMLVYYESGDNITNLVAMLIIWCIDNGYIKGEDV